MQWIASLEGHDTVPALGRQELANVARREHIFAELGILGLRQDADLAAQKVRLVGITFEHHVATGMVSAFGEIDRFQIPRLIPLEDVGDVERRYDLARATGESNFLTLFQA